MSRPATLPTLRALRAPLAALCALLLVASLVPSALAGTDVCTGWSVSGSLDADGADDGEGMDCPFCSAAHLALAPPDMPFVEVLASRASASAPTATPRAVRARAPPMGPRAPPAA